MIPFVQARVPNPANPGRRAGRRALMALPVGLVLLLAGCGGAATPVPSWPADAIVLTADARKFDTDHLSAPAGRPFTLVLVDREAEPHNIAIRTKPGFDGDLLFRHDPISASSVVLDVGPLPAGTYYFICEIHPSMTGTITVQ